MYGTKIMYHTQRCVRVCVRKKLRERKLFKSDLMNINPKDLV